MQDNSLRGFRKSVSNRTLAPHPERGLERSCAPERDAIHAAPPELGIERIEARFHGNGFEPHRHDTYAIGLTVSGVQTFRYRGEERFSLPGQIIVLHPDELHDGGAGTDLGLRYRMIYVPPERISAALQDVSPGLPFLAEPVIDDPGFQPALIEALDDLDQEIGDLKLDGFVADLAACLVRHGAEATPARRLIDWTAVRACGNYLRQNFRSDVHSSALEEIAGMDRFALARQFRLAFGTSPHRYQLMRRLEWVRAKLAGGDSLADVAADGGFADQSHMTRHFKRAFGMTPGQWQRLVVGGCAASTLVSGRSV